MFRFIAILFFLISPADFFSQLKGKVIDNETKKGIPYVNIIVVELGTGVATDSIGEFSFQIEIPNHNRIKVSALGYSDYILEIDEEVDRQNLLIELEAKHYHLHEAVVSSGTGVLQDYTITAIASKPMDELTIIANTNLGESISNLEGVYNASTGSGIYKPVIRGLSGIRVISFLNGVRIENQQWGSDHGLGVNSIGIGQVEVIKGPSSLLYGADALGGVLYLKDEVYAKNNSVEGSLFSRVESNNKGIQNGLSFKMSKNNLRFNVFVTQQSFADYQIPNGQYVKTSRFSGQGAKFNLGYHKKRWVSNFTYNYSNNTVGIPGHTHDTIVTPQTFLRDNQVREEGRPSQKIRNHFISFDNQFFFHESELKITIGQMFNQLAEYEKFTVPHIGMNLNTTTYYARYKHKLGKSMNIITGLQGMYQMNVNMPEADELLILNMTTFDKGAFALLAGKHKKLNYQVGFRYDDRQVSVSELTNGNFNYSGINYSGGISYKYKDFSFRFNASSGFRTPHASELLSEGGHSAAQRYEIGSTSLKPETGNQLDFSVEYGDEHLSLMVNPFVNFIQNFIYLQPDDSIVNGFQVYYYQQADRADLIGGEVVFHYHPHFLHDFHLESNFSMVYAQNQNGEALSFIPQPRVITQLTYNFDNEKNKKFTVKNVSLQHQFFAEQNRIVSYELTSNAYQLIHLGLNSTLKLGKQDFDISAGVKNILNESYIDHLSALKNYGIQNQGRNIYLAVKYNLKSKLN